MQAVFHVRGKNQPKVMLRKLLILSLVCQSVIMLTGCDSDKPEKVSRRTILVYMVAANSLGASGFDLADINEMKTAANKGLNGCRLLVYHNSMDAPPVLKEITSSGEKTLVNYTDAEYSTSRSRMEEVMADVKELAPAYDYGLVLWSHASAWAAPTIDADKRKSFGDDRNRQMSIPTLASVLKGKGFSFVYFDCCYMANVETLYELRSVTPLVAGSTIELPADGMPYDRNVPLMCENVVDLKKMCENTFNYYNTKTSSTQRTCTMSLIDMTRLDALADVCRRIYGLHTTPAEDFDPQRFQTGDKPLLFDLAQYMHALDTNGLYAAPLAKSIGDAVLYEAHTDRIWGSIDIENNCGLSCYIVNSTDGPSYKGYDELQWWKQVINN